MTAIALVTGVAAAPPAWEPMIANYCLDCHDADSEKGGVDLEAALDEPLGQSSELWENVARQLRAAQMPPIGEERPGPEEFARVSQALETELDRRAAAHPNPGRTDTLRRLNRREYRNAISDLLALQIDVASLLPPDQSSNGFDNITVGDLSPALLERYIAAAQKISRRALGGGGKSPDGRTVRLRPDITQEGHVEGLPLGTRGGALIRHHFSQNGDYEIRVHLMRDRDEKVEGLNGNHELQVLLDGAVAKKFEVKPPKNRNDHTKVDAHLAARMKVSAGPRDLGVTFVQRASAIAQTLRQPYQAHFNRHRHPRLTPAIYQVSITGPFDSEGVGDTLSRRLVFGEVETRDEGGAREILAKLIRRAYRGNDDETDLERAMAFYLKGEASGGFEGGIENALSAILVSPKFLFRVERDPEGIAAGAAYPLGDVELASRLSFFLWGSIPDDALLSAAAAGELTDPAGLAKQARRMLADARSDSLVKDFAGQWLYLRNLDAFTPDSRLFPDFDDNLRQAMRRETELLFENVMREDRSVSDLVSSDFTFLNERLAKHYGIPHVYGERFRRVKLEPDSVRGGILRHGSILTVTSYANRTSPVLRGHWVMKNVLGTPLPPPPPDVPSLDDNTVDASLPVRERLAVHRENPACAGCHDVMDPLGFAFENFDAIGRWRTREGEARVNSDGRMADGSSFQGIAGLEQRLLERPGVFARTMTEKLLTFALGRGITPSDGPAIRAIVCAAAEEDYRFSAIVLGIVQSEPFMMRMTKP